MTRKELDKETRALMDDFFDGLAELARNKLPRLDVDLQDVDRGDFGQLKNSNRPKKSDKSEGRKI